MFSPTLNSAIPRRRQRRSPVRPATPRRRVLGDHQPDVAGRAQPDDHTPPRRDRIALAAMIGSVYSVAKMLTMPPVHDDERRNDQRTVVELDVDDQRMLLRQLQQAHCRWPSVPRSAIDNEEERIDRPRALAP